MTQQINENVFLIRTQNGGPATGFRIKYKDNYYLITAKHVFESMAYPNECDVYISINSKEEIQEVKCATEIFYSADDQIDIAVARLKDPFPFQSQYVFQDFFDSGKTYISQEVFFAGFPLGYCTHFDHFEYLIPIIKKAVVCGFNLEGQDEILLDGHNNPGFSGGPVVSLHNSKAYIHSVICGYYHDQKQPLDSKFSHLIKKSLEKRGFDKKFQEAIDEILHIYAFNFHQNSGIIYTYPIKFALQIIDLLNKDN